MTTWRPPRVLGALCGKALVSAFCLVLLISAATGDDTVVETSHALIESPQGQGLRVVFAPEGQPAPIFKPTRGVWDWSLTSKLVIPVENLSDEPLILLVRVENGASRSLSGKLGIAPRSAGDLAIWIDAPSPRAMGMIAGPSLTAAGLEPWTLPVTATNGSVDASHVTSVRFGISRPAAPRRLAVGPLRVEPPSEAERNPYQGIVNGFGQLRPGTWPEKVSSAAMLRASGAEEAQELAQWHAQGGAATPRRDRFGGLEGAASGQPDFFAPSDATADGGWSPPRETAFSRSG